MDSSRPLVSILIPNYNHSRYLDECIQSALNQTYPNIEIIVLDNCSDDSSVKVAEKYIDKGVCICRNQFNILNRSYCILANELANGKYFMLLCADDFIHPEFIDKCVKVMEKYTNVGYVHAEKAFINEDGVKKSLDPFYNCSFVAPGRNTMPIYMMTPVAHPSQALIRMDAFKHIEGYDKEIDHMNADRTLWFYLSYYYDAAYIREELCDIRVGNNTETFITQKNFQHPILCHLTIKDFVKFAKDKDLPEVYNREEEALRRLAIEFVGYGIGMMSVEDFDKCHDYLTYATVLYEGIVNDDLYIRAEDMCNKRQFTGMPVASDKKKRNYEPPADYVKIIV